jgi:hypothetical protein
MTQKRCYRLANHKETVDARGDAARDALVAHGYDLVSEIDCLTGTVTAQADDSEVARVRQEHEAFAALPDDEQRALRRQAGGVAIEPGGQLIPWPAGGNVH